MGNCLFPSKVQDPEDSNNFDDQNLSRNREPSKIQEKIKALEEASRYKKQDPVVLTAEKLWQTSSESNEDKGATEHCPIVQKNNSLNTNDKVIDKKQVKVQSKRVKRQAPLPPTQNISKPETGNSVTVQKREPSKIENRTKSLKEASTLNKADSNNTKANSAIVQKNEPSKIENRIKSLKEASTFNKADSNTKASLCSAEGIDTPTANTFPEQQRDKVILQSTKSQIDKEEPVEIRKRERSKIEQRIQSLREAGTFKKDQKECSPKVLWEMTPLQESPEENASIARNVSRYKSFCPLNSKLDKKYVKETELVDFEAFADHGLKPEDGDMKEVLELFDKMKHGLEIDPSFTTFTAFFPALLEKVNGRLPDKSASLLRSLESQAAKSAYEENKVGEGKVAVVLGAGPCGLRLAMELQMLGARTIVVEKREQMTRNNVLRLWPFIMEDLKRLGVRKLYPQLEHGSINHISIRMLQVILLKLALLLGVEVRSAESFVSLKEPDGRRGWRAVTSKGELDCDLIFCATGCNIPEGLGSFSKKKPEFKMAIAVTANFRRGLDNEKNVEEIPGLARQNKMEYFKELEERYNVGLENIVYFKDMTNYFVMTVKKDSLLKNGILKEDVSKEDLLDKDNQNMDALKEFVLKAAVHSTEGNPVKKSARLDCSLDNLVDVSIFNFSELYRSAQASRVIERRGRRLLIGLVGDSLMQPFWPEGLGISRGFLSVWDAAWMVRQFCLKPKDKVLEVLAEREKLYSLQKTVDNKLEKNYNEWSIDPATRYPSDALREPYNRSVLEQFDSSD